MSTKYPIKYMIPMDSILEKQEADNCPLLLKVALKELIESRDYILEDPYMEEKIKNQTAEMLQFRASLLIWSLEN